MLALNTSVLAATRTHEHSPARVGVPHAAWGSSFQVQLQAKFPVKEPSSGLALRGLSDPGSSRTPTAPCPC